MSIRGRRSAGGCFDAARMKLRREGLRDENERARTRERPGEGGRKRVIERERRPKEGTKGWLYSREMRECSYRLSFWCKGRRRGRRVLSNSVCKLFACVSDLQENALNFYQSAFGKPQRRRGESGGTVSSEESCSIYRAKLTTIISGESVCPPFAGVSLPRVSFISAIVRRA